MVEKKTPSEFLARNLLRGNRRRNTFRISFWCLAWGSNPDFSFNKPTHLLLDHRDIMAPPTFSKFQFSKLIQYLFTHFKLLFSYILLTFTALCSESITNSIKSLTIRIEIPNDSYRKLLFVISIGIVFYVCWIGHSISTCKLISLKIKHFFEVFSLNVNLFFYIFCLLYLLFT